MASSMMGCDTAIFCDHGVSGRWREGKCVCRESLMNPETLRRAMEPQNVQAMLQMQQAMQQLQSSGVMPAGSMPGLGTGLGGPLGGGAGQPSGISQLILINW
jgi:hypothetical protein